MFWKIGGPWINLGEITSQKIHQRFWRSGTEKLCPFTVEEGEFSLILVNDETLDTVEVTVTREPASRFECKDRLEAVLVGDDLIVCGFSFALWG